MYRTYLVEKLYDPLFIKEKQQDFSKIKRLLSELEVQEYKDSIQQNKINHEDLQKQKETSLVESNPKVEPFIFNPNSASFEEFQKLGLSKKLSHTIINYREKGGHFYKKEDLKKIYGLDQDEYLRLENFISIPSDKSLAAGNTSNNKRNVEQKEKKEYSPERNVTYEINSIDSLSLLNIHGIGPSFSSRILKYRSLLGGYRSKSQLLEVYGMDSSRWEKLVMRIEIDTANIQKIPINTSEWIDLVKHPYIDKEAANNIVNHRKYNGQFIEVSDLMNYYLVNKQLYRKIAPYLKIDDRVEAKKTD